MKRYYVYMLQCFDGTFYVGVTNNVDRRLFEHRSGFDRECYTFSRRPLRLVYVTDFRWVHDAINFEKTLKKWSHRKKRALAMGRWDEVSRYARGPNASDAGRNAAPPPE